MARLMGDSDEEEFPDLAQLLLNPRVPLTSTKANERNPKPCSPRKVGSPVESPRKIRDHGSRDDVTDGKTYDTENIDFVKIKSLDATRLPFALGTVSKPCGSVRLEISASLLLSDQRPVSVIGALRHAIFEGNGGQVGLKSDDSDNDACWKPKPWTSPKKTHKSGSKPSKTRDPMLGREIIDLTSPTEKPVRKSRRDLGQNAHSTPGSDSEAIIKFSPPRLKSPLRRPPRERLATPPQSPIKSRLTSPKKSTIIPPTPHRPTLDAFWSQELVNAWNDEHSPNKALRSPRKISALDVGDEGDDSLRDSSGKSPEKSPRKKTREEIQARKMFEAQKQTIAELFVRELDNRVCGGEVQRLASTTGGIKLEWSKKLNSTAGRAHWRREGTKMCGEDGTTTTTYIHTASIELAEKVIDNEDRLLNVVAHEYCHLANFMVSQVTKEPHGASFKEWAAKTSNAFSERGIHVTTKHDYDIAYKYIWQCSSEDCGAEYARHSKSINPKKQSCGKCKSRLVQILPVPRGGITVTSDGGGAEGQTEYQQFVKNQFSMVRAELAPGSPMKDVMKELGARYRARKKQDDGGNNKNVAFEPVLGIQGEEVNGVARLLDFLTIKS